MRLRVKRKIFVFGLDISAEIGKARGGESGYDAGILTVDETFASFGSPVIVAEPALDASPEGGLSQGIYRG
ncbi:MAG: hypothetical protein A2Y56_12490 [Candidatus Aminicenantes bacterium RBG_13_63_10]|nr:MAG: hypothetical protein A2Y56_12490 [Candidatus Aminicenantes bacterium RBG_13_63_10]